jgi:hypothetical protein
VALFVGDKVADIVYNTTGNFGAFAVQLVTKLALLAGAAIVQAIGRAIQSSIEFVVRQGLGAELPEGLAEASLESFNDILDYIGQLVVYAFAATRRVLAAASTPFLGAPTGPPPLLAGGAVVLPPEAAKVLVLLVALTAVSVDVPELQGSAETALGLFLHRGLRTLL